MTRFIFILLLFFWAELDLISQQQPLFSQFAFNKMAFNPSMTGYDGLAQITLVNRNQWAGIIGAPKTQMINFSSHRFLNHSYWGIQAQRHTIGIQERIEFTGSYSTDISFLPSAWRLGIQFSTRRYQLDFTDPNLVALDGFTLDPNLDQSIVSSSNFNIGAAISYQTENFFAGLSFPLILRNNIRTGNPQVRNIESYLLYFMLGAKVSMGENWNYHPEILFKISDNTPYNLDLLSLFKYQDNLNFGINIRSGGSQNAILESFNYIIGFDFSKNVFAGISYDITMSGLREVENGSIELLLKYRFDKKTNNEWDIIPFDSLNIINVLDSTLILDNSFSDENMNLENMKSELLSGKKLILEDIYFDFNSSKIDSIAAKNLDILVDILMDQKNISIRLISFTDSRGTEEYNLQLSKMRANATQEYLVSKGIPESRIIALGFGESQIRNHCYEGVDCSEEEHNYNRRTEVYLHKK